MQLERQLQEVGQQKESLEVEVAELQHSMTRAEQDAADARAELQRYCTAWRSCLRLAFTEDPVLTLMRTYHPGDLQTNFKCRCGSELVEFIQQQQLQQHVAPALHSVVAISDLGWDLAQ